MRIKCHSVDDFLSNLVDQKVYRDTVYVDRSVRSLSDESSRDSHKVEVVVQASTVLEYWEDPKNTDTGVYDRYVGQALLECGESCGHDLRTADGHSDGSEKAKELRSKIELFCSANGLMVKPGVLDI